MNHLAEHRDPLPTSEVFYRKNCLVGKQVAAEQDFDININAPKLEPQHKTAICLTMAPGIRNSLAYSKASALWNEI